MRRALWLSPLLIFVIAQPAPAQQDKAGKVLVEGLKNPRGVLIGPGGKVFVTVAGKIGGDIKGKGSIVVLENGEAKKFCADLNYPTGIAAFHQWLFVADVDRVWKIDPSGNAKVFAAAEAFPVNPGWFWGITVDPESGTVYVADKGLLKEDKDESAAVYRITPQGKVSVVTNKTKMPELAQPSALSMDGASHLLVADWFGGILYRVTIATGRAEKVADSLGKPFGLAWDNFGRLYISDNKQFTDKDNRILAIPRPGEKPVALPFKFGSPTQLCVRPSGQSLIVVDSKDGTVREIPAEIPGWEVDTSPLKLETELAWPKMKWAGWEPVNAAGKLNDFRPLLVTHANDGSNRVYVGTQQGVVYVFPNTPDAEKSEKFLDISDKVLYNPFENEQGFLGLAFHPDFKKNGEVYAFYTPKKLKLTNYLVRFRVAKDDPTRLDPASEEVLLEIKRPFWNHDGGTVIFGPDGYLYVALGDGGLANDPYNNAQNLKQPLGHILRLDVNKQDPGKKYAIPKDNPFVGREGVMPEIYAYGLRNVWRMAFDKKTGELWAADVGQNLYEEINLIVKGGNYGWKLREGLHPFGPNGTGPRPDLIEPIWEYHHNVGKSITGGFVYRGEKFPELKGHYLHADYVTGKIWALLYDKDKKRVVANRTIKDRNLPIMSWGEDEKGEAYLTTYSNAGKGIFQLVRSK